MLLEAEQCGQLAFPNIDFHYYKHPAGYRRDYIRIGPEQLVPLEPNQRTFATELREATAAVGPMYKRLKVELTARMKRELELQQLAHTVRTADPTR